MKISLLLFSAFATTGALATIASVARAVPAVLPALVPIMPTTALPTTQPMQTFRNPLKVNGADPCLFYYDGFYYLSATTASDIKLRRAKKIGELADAPDVQVWKDDDPTRDRDIWAPEFHMLNAGDGSGPRWYLYYTASAGPEPSHRMYVAQSAGTDPMGPYTFKSKMLTDAKDEHYAIDGTVARLPNGQLVFAWCGRPSPYGQGIFISKMTNPWTLSGERTSLDTDGFGCQVVREGPEFLMHGDKIFLVYSMCDASTPDYRMSALIGNIGDDLSLSASWQQLPRLLMARADQNGAWGPGHNFFFKSPDGTQDWQAYHAKISTDKTFGDRSARAQKITWRADGTPEFGIAAAYETPLEVPSGE